VTSKTTIEIVENIHESTKNLKNTFPQADKFAAIIVSSAENLAVTGNKSKVCVE
jgi:hypothetical protein